MNSESVSRPSLYRQLLGAQLDVVPPAVRAFHELQGSFSLVGDCCIEGPESLLGKMLAWVIGTPRSNGAGLIRFELYADPALEVWTRHFPNQTMRSNFRLIDGQLVECLGPTRLRFRIDCSSESLNMRLLSLQFLGIPCPRGLLPAIVAEETERNGGLHFRVGAYLPLIGRVVSYEGDLTLELSKATP